MTPVTSLRNGPCSSTIFTVEWVPGTDRLLGTCFCRAQKGSEDPIQLWDWLTGHPVGHRPPAATTRPDPDTTPDLALTGEVTS